MTGTNWSEVPTTIIEMGFLSNPDEDRYMTYDIFRVDAAKGIANGLDAFFQTTAEGGSTASDTSSAPVETEKK